MELENLRMAASTAMEDMQNSPDEARERLADIKCSIEAVLDTIEPADQLAILLLDYTKHSRCYPSEIRKICVGTGLESWAAEIVRAFQNRRETGWMDDLESY